MKYKIKNLECYMIISRNKSTILKGLAILSVFISHYGILSQVAATGVAVFLFLSGYGLEKSTSKNGLDSFWKKRIRSVYIPYWIVTITFTILLALTSNFSLYDYIKYISIINFDSKIDPTMWYVTYLTLCYFIFYIINKHIKNNIPFAYLISPFILLLVTQPSFGSSYGVILYFPYFFFGALFARYSALIKKDIPSKAVFTLVILTILTMYFSITHVYTPTYFMSILLSTITLILLPDKLFNKGFISSKMLKIGNISYELYLIEGVMLMTINGSLMKYIHEGYIRIPIIFISTIILSLILKKIIDSSIINKIKLNIN